MTSSATTSGDNAADLNPCTAAAAEPTVPLDNRRKVAIFFAYCGVGYQGMQKNPGAKTIEGDLEEALFLAGAVPEQDRGQPKRWELARSARTDKGVSAVCQVVSGRFCVDPPGFVHRLNSYLPDQIRILGYKVVTPSFHAKKNCDRRRYVYLLPVFALDPSCHRDRESVMASLGSGSVLVKCVECSERGRKIPGLMGKRESRVNSGGDVIPNDVFVAGSRSLELPGISTSSENATVTIGCESESVFQSGTSSNSDTAMLVSAENKDGRHSGSGMLNGVKRSEFSYGDKVKERFNMILKRYEGTLNFHNFTTRMKAEDPAAKRCIISFNADRIVAIEGIDFVRCEVLGQSFMLHQIRKMIGMAVAVMRGVAPESIFDTAFNLDVSINVPTAPEVGLYLDECFFTSYNSQWQDSHEEVSIKAYAEEAEEFKMKYIYSHIGNTEHKEGSVGLWLHSLNHRNYPDLRVPEPRLHNSEL